MKRRTKIMITKPVYPALFLCAFLISSCATLITGTKQNIHFDSRPQGARVEVNGLDVGKTPCDVMVSSSLQQKVFTFKLDGYQPKTVEAGRTLNPIAILDWFTLLGLIVDIGTGALMKYDPTSYIVTLDPVESGALDPDILKTRRYFYYKCKK